MHDDTKVCDGDGGCGGEMVYEAPHEAWPDIGVMDPWLGGYVCTGCDRVEENEPRDLDAEAKDIPLVMLGQGSFQRAYTPKLRRRA